MTTASPPHATVCRFCNRQQPFSLIFLFLKRKKNIIKTWLRGGCFGIPSAVARFRRLLPAYTGFETKTSTQ
nr:MAG TPA: hypothetical protein [Caudoviricetes sp.]